MSQYDDRFTQADEAPLSSGGIWTGNGVFVDLQVVSHRLRVQTADGFFKGSLQTAFTAVDSFVQFRVPTWTISSGFPQFGAILRQNTANGVNTHYDVQVNTDAVNSILQYNRVTTGSTVQLGTDLNITFNAGDTFLATITGTASGSTVLKAYRNGALLSSQTDSGTPISAAGYTGCRESTTVIGNVELDAFLSGDSEIRIPWRLQAGIGALIAQ